MSISVDYLPDWRKRLVNPAVITIFSAFVAFSLCWSSFCKNNFILHLPCLFKFKDYLKWNFFNYPMKVLEIFKSKCWILPGLPSSQKCVRFVGFVDVFKEIMNQHAILFSVIKNINSCRNSSGLAKCIHLPLSHPWASAFIYSRLSPSIKRILKMPSSSSSACSIIPTKYVFSYCSSDFKALLTGW